MISIKGIMNTKRPAGVRVISGIVCIYIILALCTCLHAEASGSPSLNSPAVKALIQELHKAEANLQSCTDEADLNNPELKAYKSRKEVVSNWYWNDRMKSWDEMASDLYGTDPSQKDYRLKMFERAKHYAFILSLCEAARSAKDDWIFKSLYRTEEARTEFAEEHGITISDPADSEQFIEQVKTFYRNNAAGIELQLLKWRENHSFITPAVWRQAELDVKAEFEIDALEIAINELTPSEVRDAEQRVNEIRQKLTQIAPHWEELRRLGNELQSSDVSDIDDKISSPLQDRNHEAEPKEQGQGHSNESTRKATRPELIVHDGAETNVSQETQVVNSSERNGLGLSMLWILLGTVVGLAGIYTWRYCKSRMVINERE